MKLLKSIAVLAASVFTLNMVAENTAEAKIVFESNIADPVAVFVYENATETQLVDYIKPISVGDYTISAYAKIGTKQYGSVKQANLDGLQIYFKANPTETNYSITFSNVSGTEYFLQKGNDVEHLIPMTEDYALNCAVSEEIIFTLVKKVVPGTYIRDVTPGQWGTICYPAAITEVQGGVLYELTGATETQVFAVEVDLSGDNATEAGRPYVFKADADATQLVMPYEGKDEEEPVEANGLVGTFVDATVPAGAYGIMNNYVVEIAAGNPLLANRAYIDMDDLKVAPGAPIRGRAIFMIQNATTDMPAIEAAGMMNGTYMVNGQLMIVKDGKMFNILGL